MKVAWVPLKDIPPGHFIDAKDIKEVRLPDDGSSGNLFSVKEEIAGKGPRSSAAREHRLPARCSLKKSRHRPIFVIGR